MEEPGPMAATLERQDSAGSGNEPHEAGSIQRQLRAVAAERDRQAARSNELCQQLQEKRRQLFAAIQEREKLKEQVQGASEQGGGVGACHSHAAERFARQQGRALPCLS